MFWRPIDQDQVLTTWSEGRQMAWSSIYGCVTSQHFRPVNQILTYNKKATINLLKLLLGFKSILYLMPSTQHTQSCVFIKITVQNWFFFTSSVRDHWPEPSEKLGSQIEEQEWPGHEDQVVLAPDHVFVLRTQSWSGSPKRTLNCVKLVYPGCVWNSPIKIDITLVSTRDTCKMGAATPS